MYLSIFVSCVVLELPMKNSSLGSLSGKVSVNESVHCFNLTFLLSSILSGNCSAASLSSDQDFSLHIMYACFS